MSTDPARVAAREAARRDDGRFGEQPHNDPGGDVLGDRTRHELAVILADGSLATDDFRGVWLASSPAQVEQVAAALIDTGRYGSRVSFEMVRPGGRYGSEMDIEQAQVQVTIDPGDGSGPFLVAHRVPVGEFDVRTRFFTAAVDTAVVVDRHLRDAVERAARIEAAL